MSATPEHDVERHTVLAVVKAIWRRDDDGWPCDVAACLEPASARVVWVIGCYGEQSSYLCDEHRPPGDEVA